MDYNVNKVQRPENKHTELLSHVSAHQSFGHLALSLLSIYPPHPHPNTHFVFLNKQSKQVQQSWDMLLAWGQLRQTALLIGQLGSSAHTPCLSAWISLRIRTSAPDQSEANNLLLPAHWTKLATIEMHCTVLTPGGAVEHAPGMLWDDQQETRWCVCVLQKILRRECVWVLPQPCTRKIKSRIFP